MSHIFSVYVYSYAQHTWSKYIDMCLTSNTVELMSNDASLIRSGVRRSVLSSENGARNFFGMKPLDPAIENITHYVKLK